MPYYSADQKNSSTIFNCHKCQTKITEAQHCVECDKCHKYFHLRCEGVIGQHIARSLEEWYCKECKANTASDNTKRTIADTSPEDFINNPNKRQNTLETPTSKNETKLDKIFNCLKDLQTSHKDIKDMVKDVKDNQEFLSSQFEKLEKKLGNIEKEQSKMKNDLFSVHKIQNEHSDIIYNLEAEVDSYKQQELENNIVIGGLSKNFDEQTVIQNIMSTLKTNCTISDVKEIFKLTGKQSNQNSSASSGTSNLPPLLLVKFKSNEAKMELVNKKHEKKSLFANEIGLNTAPDRLIFIRDHVTSFKMNLFNECKKIKTQFGFRYLWMSGSRILMRKLEKSKVHAISSRNDVNKLLFFLSQSQNQSSFSQSQTI